MTVSEFLLTRLNELNAKHLFGIPGDYVLPFFDELVDKKTGVTHVNSRNELNAAYSADGYAKRAGFGAAAVTFGVGSLSATNAIGGAYADNTPMILICGGPTRATMATTGNDLYHHLVDQRNDTSLKVMSEVTIKAHRLELLTNAQKEIDDLLLLSFKSKKPVYLEIPYDLQKAEVNEKFEPLEFNKSLTNQTQLKAVLEKVKPLLENAKSVATLTGPLLDRNKLTNLALEFVEQINSPVATVFTSKVGNIEGHKNSVGIYEGHVSEEYPTQVMEQANTLVTLGNTYNEFDMGVFTDQIGKNQDTIHVMNDKVIINGVYFNDVYMTEFLPQLVELSKTLKAKEFQVDHSKRRFTFELNDKFEANTNDLTIDRMFVQFANFLKEGDTLVGDTGGYINSSQAEMKQGVDIYGCGNWGSLGAGFGMSVGASFSKDKGEVISITGDGAFLMSAQELSTLIEHKRDVTLIVLDNSGYGAERQIYPGKERSYNDFLPWNYEKLGEAFGGKEGKDVHSYTAKTEHDLDRVFNQVRKVNGVKIVRVYLDPWDTASFNVRFSEALRH